MTDWQQPLIVALTQAHGISIVHETVYENRFGFTEALVEMGADIVVHKEGIASVTRRVPRRALEQAAVITGPTPLHGADVEIPDLRGGFSHLIAALTAEGTSTVSNVGLISRGYEHFIDKLTDLGADFDVRGLSGVAAAVGEGEDARRRASGGFSPASSSRSCSCSGGTRSSAAGESRRPARSSSRPTTSPTSTRSSRRTCSGARAVCRGSSPRRACSGCPCSAGRCARPARSRSSAPGGAARRATRSDRGSTLRRRRARADHLPRGHAHPRPRRVADARQVRCGAARARARRRDHPDGHWGAQEMLPRYSKRLEPVPAQERCACSSASRSASPRGRTRRARPRPYAAATHAVMQAITALVSKPAGRDRPPEVRWDPAEHGQTEFGRLESNRRTAAQGRMDR